jgi:23S rRNA (uracil1939-C5)-methyltransferase
MPEAGEELELEVEALAPGGAGVARHGGLAVFVERGLPGQRVLARVSRVQKRHAEALSVETLRQTEDHTEPFCEHFPECGGCAFQDLDYPAQLRWKRDWVVENLRRIAGLDEVRICEALPSPETRRFRNKMEFAFAGSRGRGLHMGLRSRLDPSRLVDVRDCRIQSEEMNALCKRVRELARESGAPAFNTRSGKGFWRFLVVRRSQAGGELLAQVVTAPKKNFDPVVQRLCERLRLDFPGLTFVHSVRFAGSAVAQGQKRIFASGSGSITEKLLGMSYEVPAEAFFQTNAPAAARLYAEVMDMASPAGTGKVLDLYSGVGCPALNLAAESGSVTGLEILPEAVEYARKNAQRNGLDNVSFLVADAAGIVAGQSAEVIVADPPRAGMDRAVLDAIMRLAPRRLVYVSCNPATLARDAGRLAESFGLEEVRPVDLFPHAAHVECAALFRPLK